MSSVLTRAGLLQRQGGITPMTGMLEWKDAGSLGGTGTGGKVGVQGAPSGVRGAQPGDG